jgi:hypothetical protein
MTKVTFKIVYKRIRYICKKGRLINGMIVRRKQSKRNIKLKTYPLVVFFYLFKARESKRMSGLRTFSRE